MSNHFHLLLRQEKEKGISKYLSQFQNSYTRYFNSKQKRKGSLFLDQFKAVRILTENQLLHVFRYIILNPYSSYIVKNLKEVREYKWSSCREYLGTGGIGLCDKELITSYFRDNDELKEFIYNALLGSLMFALGLWLKKKFI